MDKIRDPGLAGLEQKPSRQKDTKRKRRGKRLKTETEKRKTPVMENIAKIVSWRVRVRVKRKVTQEEMQIRWMMI